MVKLRTIAEIIYDDLELIVLNESMTEKVDNLKNVSITKLLNENSIYLDYLVCGIRSNEKRGLQIAVKR